jgi:hypothetical protein
MTKIKYDVISQNEVKFEYKGYKFLLREKSCGVLGAGRCVNLLQLEGLTTKQLKTIGRTKTDNSGTESSFNTLLKGIVTFEDCKEPSIKYIDSLLK